MNIVIIGCGFGGVEVASKLRKRSKDLDITMIGRRTRLEYQAAHPEVLSGKVTAEEISGDLNEFAARINAEFINEAVVNIDFEAKTVKTKEEREIPYDIIIWTAGIKPNGLLENLELGIPKERGWLKVDPYLRVYGMKDVFAVGDTAYSENEGIRSGQNVEEAERQGKLAAKNIIRAIKGNKLKRYRAKNTIQNPRAFISLGNDKAVMYFGGMMFKVFAYRVKKFMERRYMRRFR